MATREYSTVGTFLRSQFETFNQHTKIPTHSLGASPRRQSNREPPELVDVQNLPFVLVHANQSNRRHNNPKLMNRSPTTCVLPTPTATPTWNGGLATDLSVVFSISTWVQSCCKRVIFRHLYSQSRTTFHRSERAPSGHRVKTNEKVGVDRTTCQP